MFLHGSQVFTDVMLTRGQTGVHSLEEEEIWTQTENIERMLGDGAGSDWDYVSTGQGRLGTGRWRMQKGPFTGSFVGRGPVHTWIWSSSVQTVQEEISDV